MSTPGPQEHGETDQHDDHEEDDLVLDVGQVLELLDSQAAGIHDEIGTVTEAYEGEGQLPVDEVNSIRTEVMELQATVEDHLAATCDGTQPWDHVDELVPRERLAALRGGA